MSGWILVGRENNCLESYVLCPWILNINKWEKHNHSRPLNHENIEKFIIKLNIHTPGMSAPKSMLSTHLRYKKNPLRKEFVTLCSNNFVVFCSKEFVVKCLWYFRSGRRVKISSILWLSLVRSSIFTASKSVPAFCKVRKILKVYSMRPLPIRYQ